MEDISRAVDLLKSGEVVGMPTETVYGLAADVANDLAVAKIYELKTRPSFNPLIVHVASLEKALEIAEFNDAALELAKKHWPGGLTLVLPKKDKNFAKLASAGLDTIAVRVPNHPIARKLLEESGLMLAAPSANISGSLSPTNAQHVRANFPDIYIVDGGECEVGLESTVVGFEDGQPVLLRHGVLQIEEALPLTPYPDGRGDVLRSPGQLVKHYAPKNSIRINVMDPKLEEKVLGFGDVECDLNLSASGNLVEAAANLFAMLHELDESAKPIAVTSVPDEGVGIAINDRLMRAVE